MFVYYTKKNHFYYWKQLYGIIVALYDVCCIYALIFAAYTLQCQQILALIIMFDLRNSHFARNCILMIYLLLWRIADYISVELL